MESPTEILDHQNEKSNLDNANLPVLQILSFEIILHEEENGWLKDKLSLRLHFQYFLFPSYLVSPEK